MSAGLPDRVRADLRSGLAGEDVHVDGQVVLLDGRPERIPHWVVVAPLGQRVVGNEDPAEAKGIVRREVVETITPGAILSDALLSERRNNFLVALAPGERVLVHAVTSNLAVWLFSGVADALAADFRVTLYDLRGHGASDRPPAGYTSLTIH